MTDLSFWNRLSLMAKNSELTYEKVCELVDESFSEGSTRIPIKNAFKNILKCNEVETEATTKGFSRKVHRGNELTELIMSKDKVSLMNDIMPTLMKKFKGHTVTRQTPVVIDDYVRNGVRAASEDVWGYPQVELQGSSAYVTDFIYKKK